MAPLPAPASPEAPKYWTFETGGELRGAVETFVQYPFRVTDRQLTLLRAYFVQWIDSPAWECNPHASDAAIANLAVLRRQAHMIASVPDALNFVRATVPVGLDPL